MSVATLPEVLPSTLQDDAAEDHLLAKIITALRALETQGDVRQVIASPSHGVIVVMDHDYGHCALRVVS